MAKESKEESLTKGKKKTKGEKNAEKREKRVERKKEVLEVYEQAAQQYLQDAQLKLSKDEKKLLDKRLLRLSKEMQYWIETKQRDKDELTACEVALKDFNSLLKKHSNTLVCKRNGEFPVWTEVFGSYATGASLKASDIDIVLIDKELTLDKPLSEQLGRIDKKKQHCLTHLVNALKHDLSVEWTHIQYIKKAKVPIIKFKHKNGTRIDLCHNAIDGVQNSRFIKKACKRNPTILPVATILRRFFVNNGVGNTSIGAGGISSFATQLMTITYVENFHDGEPVEKAGEVLFNMINFFGHIFRSDLRYEVKPGHELPYIPGPEDNKKAKKKVKHDGEILGPATGIIVRNPADETRNAAGAVKTWDTIRALLREKFHLLVKTLTTPDLPEHASILSAFSSGFFDSKQPQISIKKRTRENGESHPRPSKSSRIEGEQESDSDGEPESKRNSKSKRESEESESDGDSKSEPKNKHKSNKRDESGSEESDNEVSNNKERESESDTDSKRKQKSNKRDSEESDSGSKSERTSKRKNKVDSEESGSEESDNEVNNNKSNESESSDSEMERNKERDNEERDSKGKNESDSEREESGSDEESETENKRKRDSDSSGSEESESKRKHKRVREESESEESGNMGKSKSKINKRKHTSKSESSSSSSDSE